MNFIEQKTSIILELCKKHKVKNLYAFGSVLTDHFNDESDIDFIVDFKRMPLKTYSDNEYDFKSLFKFLFESFLLSAGLFSSFIFDSSNLSPLAGMELS